MKRTGMIGTGLLSLLIGAAAPLNAQHDQKDENRDHSEQKQAKHEQAKPEQYGQQRRSEQRQQQQHADQQQRHDRNSSMLGKSSMFNRNTPSNMDKINTLNNNACTSRGRARTVKGTGTTNKPETRRNSTASSRAHGNSIAHGAGSLTIETGASAAAITATAFPTIVFVDDSARNTHSGSTACLSWSIEAIRDFNMADTGSLRLTHGRNTGGMTGTTTMTFM
jgi:hypothetical protein